MTRHKLKLKRTPEEEAEHQLRKEKKRERKRRREEQGQYGARTSSKRFHADNRDEGPSRKWASSDEDEMEYGPQPAAPSSKPNISPPNGLHGHKPDYATLQAEIEDRMFREKMFDALGDDERLDSVEARMNDFAHVPDHWRSSSSGAGKTRAHVYDDDNLLKLDPSVMDEEEYAEWIRAGMYRKTHAEEYAEQQRQKALRAARLAEEKARKAETKRLDKLAEEERKRKKAERDSRRYEQAREDYNHRWLALLAPAADKRQELCFDDIPWPIAAAHRQKSSEKRHRRMEVADESKHSICVEDLTAEAISSFLLPVTPVVGPQAEDERKKDRKDRLREAFLRFHPDKFDGRFMKRVKDDEKEKVREAIGQVSRVLNSLLDEGS